MALDPVSAKLIAEKIVALVGDPKPSTLAKTLGVSPGTAKLILTGRATDFSLSMLLRLAKKTGTSLAHIVGQSDTGGTNLHPEAYMLALIADQAIRRIAANILGPAMPSGANVQGSFVGGEGTFKNKKLRRQPTKK